jgi:hypothetical protein
LSRALHPGKTLEGMKKRDKQAAEGTVKIRVTIGTQLHCRMLKARRVSCDLRAALRVGAVRVQIQNHFFDHFWLQVDVAAGNVRLLCTSHIQARMINASSKTHIIDLKKKETKRCLRSNLDKYWAKGKLIAEEGARRFCPALDTSGIAKNLPNLSYYRVIEYVTAAIHRHQRRKLRR